MKNQKNKVLPFYTYSHFLLMLLLFCVSANISAAEYVYISDKLRVGVRTEPISGVPPISVVFTGMRLEVHKKADGYIKISTDKGVTGWIKDIYVTKKAPAIIQLNTMRAKYEKLQKTLSEGNETSAILDKANMALTEQLDELTAERGDWSRERASLMASQYKDSSWIGYIVAAILVALSFVAGIFWYKSYVMKRLGGLRV